MSLLNQGPSLPFLMNQYLPATGVQVPSGIRAAMTKADERTARLNRAHIVPGTLGGAVLGADAEGSHPVDDPEVQRLAIAGFLSTPAARAEIERADATRRQTELGAALGKAAPKLLSNLAAKYAETMATLDQSMDVLGRSTELNAANASQFISSAATAVAFSAALAAKTTAAACITAYTYLMWELLGQPRPGTLRISDVVLADTEAADSLPHTSDANQLVSLILSRGLTSDLPGSLAAYGDRVNAHVEHIRLGRADAEAEGEYFAKSGHQHGAVISL